MRHTRLLVVIAAVGFAVLPGCSSDENPVCICEDTPPAIITSLSDESAFVSQVSPIGPLDAPFTGVTDSVAVGEDLFIIRPGSGVGLIGVGNVIDTSLPSDLMVTDESYSNLDFSFGAPVSGFGFGVWSWTATDQSRYPGPSDFTVTLYHESIALGSTQFSTPASGGSFFALLSSIKFDALTLRETRGGPQNGPAGTGGVDRESFGKFYVVP